MYSKLRSIGHGFRSGTFKWLSSSLLFVFPALLNAQVVLEANYPFLTDLSDATGNYGDATLLGPVTPPSPGVPLCQDGVYYGQGTNPDGQDVVTPDITGLLTSDFQLDIDFNLPELPSEGAGSPIIVGSQSYRWIGVYVSPDGKVGVLYNNDNLVFSQAPITLGAWHTAQLRYEGGVLQLVLDGQLVLEETVGALVTDNQLEFTTNDYSRGTALDGCIRNLYLTNNTELMDAPILTISKTDSADPVDAGDMLTYTLRVDNTGSVSADGVVVTDTLPAEVALVSTSGCAEDPVGVPACTLGTIDAAAHAEYTVTVSVSAAADGTITNNASVGAVASTSEDTTVIPGADLSITKMDSSDPVIAGGNMSLVYTVEVYNAGPSDATNVVVTDVLPGLVDFNATSGCMNDPVGVPDCQLGTIVNGGSAVYHIYVDLPRADATIINSASVSGDQADPNPGNNTAEETTDLVAIPIPTLQGAGLTLLVLLMAGLGWVVIRRF